VLADELLLRGSCDFPDLAADRRFIDEVVGRRTTRAIASAFRLSALRSSHSLHRLIGHRLNVHLYDDRLECFLGSTPSIDRVLDRCGMKTINPVDAARIKLLLSELRLPAMKLMWAKFAEQSDKESSD
jgi:hypothetical protein